MAFLVVSIIGLVCVVCAARGEWAPAGLFGALLALIAWNRWLDFWGLREIIYVALALLVLMSVSSGVFWLREVWRDRFDRAGQERRRVEGEQVYARLVEQEKRRAVYGGARTEDE